MLKEAGQFAIQAKNTDLAFQVIEEMGARFEVDTFDLNAKALMVMSKSIPANEQSTAIVGSLLALTEEAATTEHYDTAKQLGTTATDLARKSKDSALLKETVARKGTIVKEMAEIQKAQADVAEAIDSLDKNPIDPAANLAVGKFCCFFQGKWHKGISMVALGNDASPEGLGGKGTQGRGGCRRSNEPGRRLVGLGREEERIGKEKHRGPRGVLVSAGIAWAVWAPEG